MNRFPQEVVDQICSHLWAEDLRSTYYVSTTFRNAAEEHAGSFKNHSINLELENKKLFINEYSCFRLRYLEHVEFFPFLPALNAQGGLSCRESADERRENDKIFTEQIRNLFATLKTVEERAGERNRGKYRLTIYCPTQKILGDYCHHREHSQWRIHLLEPEALPNLMSVTSLQIHNGQTGFGKRPDYRILIDLAAQCPNLECLMSRLGMDEWAPSYCEEPAKLFLWEYDGPRRDTRHGLAKAITSTNMPKSLCRVELDFFSREAVEDADSIHHWMATPNLVMPAAKDPFSTSLRILSYHLRIMRLRAQVDETLFWPEDGSTPTWPHLQYVFVMFHMVSPSGAWYFEGPRGEGRESAGHDITDSSYPPLETTEEDEKLDWEATEENPRSFQSIYQYWFRISPNEKVMIPFLASFAKAVVNMPELKRAILWSPLRWNVDGGSDNGDENEAFDYFEAPSEFDELDYFDASNSEFHHEYLAWGLAYSFRGAPLTFVKNPANLNLKNCNTRKIWWKVGKWRPNPEIHNLFQQIGRREHGDAFNEYWDDDEFGQGLVSRRCFDLWTPDE